MKMRIKSVLALLLTLVLIAGMALAEVRTTGNVNLRTGPGLDFEIVGSVAPDAELVYLGETRTDSRGVDWYLVEFKGGESWISSRYSELSGEEVPVASVSEMDGEWVELSGYYLCDLVDAAERLGLTDYAEMDSEAPYSYSNGALVLAGYDLVEHMSLEGAGYTLFGAACGMSVSEARERLSEAGLALYCENPNLVVFEHPAGGNSIYDANGFDSCINLECRDGAVVRMDWSTYTG